MKRTILAIFLFFNLTSICYADISTGNIQSDTLTFDITGNIVTPTCTLQPYSGTIDLGTWKTDFSGTGYTWRTTEVPFNLVFDCEAGHSVSAQLSANQYSPSNVYFIDIDHTPDAATGVVVVVHYNNGIDGWRSLRYDMPGDFVKTTVKGENTVNLRAFYRAPDDTNVNVTTGRANVTVTLTLTYS